MEESIELSVKGSGSGVGEVARGQCGGAGAGAGAGKADSWDSRDGCGCYDGSMVVGRFDAEKMSYICFGNVA